MIVLGLLLFNGLLLFGAIEVLGHMFDWLPVVNSWWISALISLGVVILLAAVLHTPPGLWLLRLIVGARVAVTREHTRLDPVIEEVQQRIEQQLGKKPIALHLMIEDDPMLNAAALGKNTLILTRGLYETASQNELQAVIAHEMGHFHNGDSQRLATILGVNAIGFVIGGGLTLLTLLIGGIMNLFAAMKDKDGAGGIISLILLPFVLIPMVLGWGVWLTYGGFNIALRIMGRREEYCADAFAVNLGYGGGLLSFLEKIKSMEFTGKKGVLQRLYETHPDPMFRIDRIDKALAGDGVVAQEAL
jgi:heat shock protein HtpX